MLLTYDNGYFYNKGEFWTETINGVVSFTFREIGRNDSSIWIYDQSRDMTVRLDYGSFWLKPSGQNEYFKLKNAVWDYRRMVSFGNGSVYFLFLEGNYWKFVAGGTSKFYREESRHSQQIIIRNDETGERILILHQKIIRLEPAPSFTLYEDGNWGLN